MDLIVRYMAGDFDVYNELAKKVCSLKGSRVSERFLTSLEETLTPQEAYICDELFEPATKKELAKNLDTDEKEFQAVLDDLIERKVVYYKKKRYGFPHSSVLASWQSQGFI